MSEKLAALEKENNQKKEDIKELKNKQVVLDEKIGIIGRKNEKYHQEYFELKNNIRRVEDKKLDEKVIEELRNYMKWSVRDLEEKIETKCSEEAHNKERAKLNEKISIIHENLIEKADKGEIMKAIFFLEEKMKEIIFLIAAEHTDERDGAVFKTNIKCLSCDKQMEKTRKANESQGGDRESGFSKPITHRVRRRYR